MFKLYEHNALTLALIDPLFAPDYFQLVCQDRDYLSQWLAWPMHAKDDAFFAEFAKRSLSEYAQGKSMVCSIFYANALVGTVSFNQIKPELKKVEIGYWLRESAQGKGLMTQSVEVMITHAFNVLHMEKIEIHAAVENKPSRGVCERLGFRLEGVITRNESINGRVVDHAVYGLSRKDWQQQKNINTNE
ncbi:MAG: GNAT family N-acetyltransferase [Vibrio sp.]